MIFSIRIIIKLVFLFSNSIISMNSFNDTVVLLLQRYLYFMNLKWTKKSIKWIDGS